MAELPGLRDRFRALTQARLLLGRAGQGLPTRALLNFQMDHARARDAVYSPLAADGFADAIGRPVIEVRSRARDRQEYLQRPDLGRALNPDDTALLPTTAGDLAIVVADGLSATAVHAHAASVVTSLVARLPDWTIAPVILARQGRVALADEIGAALGVNMTVILIGERPGLSASDSLGAYLTWDPRLGRRDSERNCVSNIRPPHGLSYEVAADTIVSLLKSARRQRLTGIALIDDGRRLSP
ncbi:ethanolamine ammonia-lyase subunit EutC [Sphingobium amiense]|uniref:Ethanolamine ammonia-lyase small subunit n=1 Tax=Sphingobium amiense TaxID=135719 RepID=A0A494WG33_9SPHN|nr:ethanolamine ammonia-lyase subunit EutC [Sphingobium amiense]BBD99659.1 ethanolamine ammonia-lyase subunit EutC [Sphingobium amiense]